MPAEIQVKSVVNLSEAVRADFFEIVEPTLRINTQDQFLKWTKNELQRLFPHSKMVCGVGRLGNQGVHIRHVLACNFPQEYIQTLQRPDGLTTSPILAKWMKEKQPILFEPDPDTSESTLPAEWLANFRKFGLVNLAAHGLCDVDSHTTSYFCFSNIPGPLSLRHAYLLKLLVPHMHAVLTRIVSSPQFKKRNPAKHQTKLTIREKEILQWLSSGKSNWEIAQVVGLSEATVKNHVYHILGKLQVNSRAQAVVKAINDKLISAKLAYILCAGMELLPQGMEMLTENLSLFV